MPFFSVLSLSLSVSLRHVRPFPVRVSKRLVRLLTEMLTKPRHSLCGNCACGGRVTLYTNSTTQTQPTQTPLKKWANTDEEWES